MSKAGKSNNISPDTPNKKRRLVALPWPTVSPHLVVNNYISRPSHMASELLSMAPLKSAENGMPLFHNVADDSVMTPPGLCVTSINDPTDLKSAFGEIVSAVQ